MIKLTRLQEQVVASTANEIALLGGRGSGRTTAMICKASAYVGDSDYFALFLVKNEQTLHYFLQRAFNLWEPYGAIYKKDHFIFPSGARIVFGHMKNVGNLEPYLCIPFQKVFIDGATDVDSTYYLDILLDSLRPTTGINRQLVYSADYKGPGVSWIKAKFSGVSPDVESGDSWKIIYMSPGVEHNPVLKDSDYAKCLSNLMDPEMRSGVLNGISI